MKKKDFVTLLMSVVGGLLFAFGMCMALLPEWNAMKPGIVLGVIGIVVLLITILVRRKMDGKPMIVFNGKVIATALIGIVGSLVFGAGLCLIMVWQMMIQGIIAGIIGLLLLLCLIPVCKGLK